MPSQLLKVGAAIILSVGAMAISATDAEACTTELSCSTTNSHGAQLVGVNDVYYHDGTNCLDRWDCEYSDGYTTRHYGSGGGGGGPEMQ